MAQHHAALKDHAGPLVLNAQIPALQAWKQPLRVAPSLHAAREFNSSSHEVRRRSAVTSPACQCDAVRESIAQSAVPRCSDQRMLSPDGPDGLE